MIARFWWDNSSTHKKVHWKSWADMCSSKCLRGMGICDMSVFNDAFLGKLAWRLVHAHGSLLSRVFQVKYYPRSSFLIPWLRGQFSWKNIWSVKSLLKEGLIWRIRDGSSVNVLDDSWAADELGSRMTSPKVSGITKARDLMIPGKAKWNYEIELLTPTFNARDFKCILSIPISKRLP